MNRVSQAKVQGKGESETYQASLVVAELECVTQMPGGGLHLDVVSDRFVEPPSGCGDTDGVEQPIRHLGRDLGLRDGEVGVLCLVPNEGPKAWVERAGVARPAVALDPKFLLQKLIHLVNVSGFSH